MIDTKAWWKSKTLWLNFVAMIIFVIQAGLGAAWIPVGYQAGIVAVLNAILRLMTGQPIQGTAAAKSAFKRALHAQSGRKE